MKREKKDNENSISKDYRSRSSNISSVNQSKSLKFFDTEEELIKVNKKMNQILQNLENQNKLLLDNVK